MIYYFSTTSRFSILIAILIGISTSAFSQEVIDLDEKNFVKLFTREAYVFEDSSNKITAEDILSGKFDSKFKRIADDKFYTEHLNVNYWLRVKLRSRNPDKDWILELPDPHISTIEFFRPNVSGKYEALKTVGFSHSFSNKEYQHKNFLFKTYLPKDTVQTLYIMVNSENYAGLSSYIREEIHFTGYALTEYVLLGLYYGILLIMAIYNIFLFFNTKDRVYIYYVIYALCCAFNSFSEDGLGFQYLWPETPFINVLVSLFTPLLLLSAFILYSFSFLEIDRTAKSFKNVIISAYILYILVYFIERFILNSQKVYQFVFLVPFLLIYIASFKIYFKGEKSARFFILAYTMIIISFIIYIFRIFDLVPVGLGLFAVYSFNFGFMIEVVILSIALSDRFKIERMQRETLQQQAISQLIENEALKNELIVELKEKEIIQDRVNKELESKVAVRTKDLQEKSEELSVFNSNLSKLVEDLNQMNIKLDLDNWQLKQKVQEEVKARLSDEELSTEKFKELFPDDASCMRYLENIKWSNGFICKKCGHDKYITHTSPFTRKCTSCKHVESVTAETLFHGIRIPMDKAFYIVYDTIRSGKSKTLEELSELLNLNKNTVWAFRKKIQSSYELLKSKSKGAVVRWDDLLSH